MQTCCTHIVSYAAAGPRTLHTQTKTGGVAIQMGGFVPATAVCRCRYVFIPFHTHSFIVHLFQHGGWCKGNKGTVQVSLTDNTCLWILFFCTDIGFSPLISLIPQLEKLMPKKRTEEQSSTWIVEKWIHTTSKHELTQTERSVLSRGLNFAIASRKHPIQGRHTSNGMSRKNGDKQGQKAALCNEITGSLKAARQSRSNIPNKGSRSREKTEKNQKTKTKQGHHNPAGW